MRRWHHALWVGVVSFLVGAAIGYASAQEPILTIRCVSLDDGTELLLYRGDFRRGRLQLVPPPNHQYKILFQATCDVTW